MLKEYLSENNIIIKEEIEDWEKAIALASSPLLESRKIEKGYVEEMIDSVKRLGPYIVISPQIAIAHSRPNGMVNQVSLSLLKLNRPVNFSAGDYEATLIFVLAAIDNEQHLGILRNLAEMLSDEEKVRQLINAQSKYEIRNLLD
ncbi:PTS sugar transporter subunit IIA [Salinicoccus albus]|uniref:PTS sugar transporter subunit IIA n=1 Tax=Salinicoccus albus TaxID=418756 RepID=UPI0003656966|nr:PTS sugar transporter subunit IIA [Salinicoccus albus]